MFFKLRDRALVIVALALCAVSVQAQEACVGDCSVDAQVTVDEIVLGVNMALGLADVSGCTPFDGNSDGQVTVDEIVTAVTNALEGCPTTGEGLGVRHFSLSTDSRFELIGLPLPLSTNAFTGFLDIEAGPEDETGRRPLDLVGSSEFLEVVLTPPIGAPVIICIQPQVEEFPVRNVGFLACGGADLAGLEIVQDHNISDVDPQCMTGMPDENPFHPGACNADFVANLLPGESGPGAAAIAPDPNTLEGGLPVSILVEDALPCGDEAVDGLDAPFALNTVLGRAVILDSANIAGNTVTAERTGENFDCSTWTQEDGPGRFVLLAPLIDFDTGLLGLVDGIAAFTLDD